ncbi:hypothetical protein ACFPOE_04970 [Caenimonas terrae]|uniref:Uncharacterized protein n=1 Tax=Caenimonas terrae TaxID=696074 RepID=A0ABW0NAD4_9BURK
MQDQGQIQIARAFGAWQRAHQKCCEAEERLAAAVLAWKQGLQPRPDALQAEVLSLKAEQERHYDVAAQALRSRNSGPAPLAA